jgi:site-specific DNA-methyltransferase (adenine-specific)
LKYPDDFINKIICGDCLEVMKGIPDKSVDLVLTDPPYSTPVITSFGRKKCKNLADLSIQEFYFNAFKKELERLLKPNGRLFIFCDDKFYPILFAVFYDWLNINLIIWDKGKIGMGNPVRKQHELIMYANRESFQYNRTENFTHYPSVMKYKSDNNKLHGAQKPLKLIRDLILGFSDKGNIILDPFTGSGVVCLASQQLDRNYIGIDLSEKYCEIAHNRVNATPETLFI